MLRRLTALFLSFAFATAMVLAELRERWLAPLAIPEAGYNLMVERGSSLGKVAAMLHANGVLQLPRLLSLYGRWTGMDQSIKPGEYELQAGITAQALLLMLYRGDVVQRQVTFPEGITLAMALDILSGHDKLESTITGTDDASILDMIQPYTHPEGLFFPDTYSYTRGDTDINILQRAHTAMLSILEEEWLMRSESAPFDTPYEVLIMASIIERETGVPEEREQISGVFNRRLQMGMLLQTDPTVIYGLGDEFDGRLRRSHLTEDANPYNTYRRPGLPPTPIALPGRASIRAALNPADGTALYFVARGDGSHVFSDNLSDHNAAVRNYQLNRRPNYTSSPRKPQ